MSIFGHRATADVTLTSPLYEYLSNVRFRKACCVPSQDSIDLVTTHLLCMSYVQNQPFGLVTGDS